MKKMKYHFNCFIFTILFGMLATIVAFCVGGWRRQILALAVVWLAVLSVGIIIIVLLSKGKKKTKIIISKILLAGNAVLISLVLVYCSLFVVVQNYSYCGNYSNSTRLFENKNVMIIIPHQDDDINLVGGLIEQYINGNSEVNVVFSTNGDVPNIGETRATEAVHVLTQLGVEEDNIYYLGFGNYWLSQTINGKKINHIYNSIEGDLVWTSQYGANNTYDTKSIPCYLDLTYTRNNYLYSMESLIQEKLPDTIFAVDLDLHIEHRSASLFFEEALCNVIKSNHQYHPAVYKGFCYGTAWMAPDDFYDSTNLLSTQLPYSEIWNNASFGYAWEDRVRFPISEPNLNYVLMNNSVYHSLEAYASQSAFRNSSCILNGDKVFWKRRTDSLIYDADVLVDGKKTTLLNDFKLRDFDDISSNPCTNTGVEVLKDKSVYIKPNKPTTVNCIYLYDNPDEYENITEGYITFSDGSKVNFGELNKDGSTTKIDFLSREVEWLEIVVTDYEGECYGLSEVELYDNSFDIQTDSCIMAVDSADNLVYDYIIPDGDIVELQICDLYNNVTLSEKDVKIDFISSDSSYSWKGDTLIVECAKRDTCNITISYGDTSTSFTVSNPSGFHRAYLLTIRCVDKINYNFKRFINQLSAYINND